jgi:hypothetical protein
LGRIGRSWDLVCQSFAVLRSDKELLFLPVVSAGFTLSFSAISLSISALIYRPEILALLATRPSRPQLPQGMYACLFILYLVNYLVVIFFNVVLVSIASDRLRGGHATLNDGLQIAWQRKGRIFQWAFLAATVGMLLRALEDRLGWLGRMIVSWIGVAWSLATYFVAPILAAEDIGPMEALYRSAGIFRETWGEELVGGFSFGLIFMFLAIPGLALILGADHWRAGRRYLLASVKRGERCGTGRLHGRAFSVCHHQGSSGRVQPPGVPGCLAPQKLDKHSPVGTPHVFHKI